jgi:RNA polymerase sigma-70 factor (ECF subfamily)
MHQHERRLYTFLLVLVRDRDAALDCLQDTFIRAFQHLRAGGAVTLPWLYTVARHRAMDEFRYRRRQQHYLEALQDEDTTEAESSVDMVAVHAILDRLSAGDREVLHLFVFERWKTAEIAEILDIKPGAVRVRLMRARERFRLLWETSP